MVVIIVDCFSFFVAYSASGVLDSSQNTVCSAGRARRLSATSVRRKSRRLSNRHAVNRCAL